MLITLLAMGCEGFGALLAKRVECMEHLRCAPAAYPTTHGGRSCRLAARGEGSGKLGELAAANGERVLDTRHNSISMVRFSDV